MKYSIYILLFFFTACQTHKTIISEGDKQPLEKHKVDKQVIGKVVNRSGPVGCQWVIKLKDGKEFMPVKWPPNTKKHNQKIKFVFRYSRAPQPQCFKGKMIVLESYSLLK
tara:strand:- start:361 stop:690 length:330 start_codon:yes stop_codon:yes gene_type:complete